MNANYDNYVVAKESFAAPIKSMVAMLLDFFGYGSIMNPSELKPYLEGDRKEDYLEKIGASPRELMQTLGTDWGRKIINENLWLDSMRERVGQYEEAEKHGHAGAFVFITDVRFDNEAEMIRELGGTIVHVSSTRLDGQLVAPHSSRLDGQLVAPHSSEAGVGAKLVDTHLINNGTLEEFYTTTATYLENYVGESLVASAPRLFANTNLGEHRE
jgi:hypothetical protein